MSSPSKSRVTIVIPSYKEGDAIVPALERIEEFVSLSKQVLVVVDFEEDPTNETLAKFSKQHPDFKCIVSTYGRGPANAIRYGIDQSASRTVVVTMADGCDDPRQIDELTLLVERGVVIASASRYMPGGQQVGGPRFKSFLSRMAGLSLNFFTNTGTRDATNSFKAYDREFVQQVGIDSRHGFEIGLELTAKARRLRRPVAEVPTIWLDRTFGESNFQMKKWIPKYLKWYRFSFGRQLDVTELRTRAAKVARESE